MQWEAVHKDDWNVATSPRRDAPTSRRPHVVTPQRRDVESIYKEFNKWRRPNVTKLQRRDVSASYSSQSLKAKGDQNSGGGGGGIGDQGTYELGHRNKSNSDFDLEEEP